MKGLLSLVVAAILLGSILAGCGGARKTTSNSVSVKSSASTQYTPQAKLGGATPAAAAAARGQLLRKIAWVKSTFQPHLPNDDDHDEPGDEDRDNSHDKGTGPGSIDPYVDYLPPANNEAYHDEDDEQALTYGHSASTTEARAVGVTVKRYYAIASRGDGAEACSMLAPSIAKAVPLDYGKFGPSYLHAGKTCAGVVTLLFEHFRAELTAPVEITNVRASDSTALAFIGSSAMRASVISLNRGGGRWRISQLIGAVLR